MKLLLILLLIAYVIQTVPIIGSYFIIKSLTNLELITFYQNILIWIIQMIEMILSISSFNFSIKYFYMFSKYSTTIDNRWLFGIWLMYSLMCLFPTVLISCLSNNNILENELLVTIILNVSIYTIISLLISWFTFHSKISGMNKIVKDKEFNKLIV